MANRERFIEYLGKSFTLAQWSEITGLHKDTLRKRLDQYGWSVEDAILKNKVKNKSDYKKVRRGYEKNKKQIGFDDLYMQVNKLMQPCV